MNVPDVRSASLLDWLYRLSLTGKGALGALQLAGALGLLLAPGGGARGFVDWLTRAELAEDPDEFLARHLVDWAAHLDRSAESFYAVYLLGHGALNLGVVLALMLRFRAAYAVSLAILGGFVAYQLLRYAAAPDPMLLVLTVIDLLVIVLVVLEHRRARSVQS